MTKNTPTKKTPAAPKAAKPQPETRPETPGPALNDFHQNLAELAGDLIMYGGEPAHVDMLLRALIAHQWSRSYSLPLVDRYVEERLPAWQKSLEAGRAERPELPEVPINDAASWIESMRQNNKARLVGEFSHFLDLASPEEVFFLFEVLERFRHETGSPEEERFRQDAPLLDCIATSIGAAHNYIRVPDELAEVVRKQVAVLIEASEKKVA